VRLHVGGVLPTNVRVPAGSETVLFLQDAFTWPISPRLRMVTRARTRERTRENCSSVDANLA